MDFLFFFLRAVSYIVVADVLLSWVMPPERFPRSITAQMTEPLYKPIRALLPTSTGGLDFAPLILIFGTQMLSRFLLQQF